MKRTGLAMNNKEVNNPGINTEFRRFIATYPKASLVEIAKRRVGEQGENETDAEYQQRILDCVNNMSPTIKPGEEPISSLSNPNADKNVIPVYQKAIGELKQLIAPMGDEVWNLAYKYFPKVVRGCKTESDKMEAISDEFELSENRIDAENELKDIVKEAIGKTPFIFRKQKMTLFSEDEAMNSTPQELCENLEEKVYEMTNIIEQDEQDQFAYRDAMSADLTFPELFTMLADFLTKKLAETKKSKNGTPIYKFNYDEDNECVVGKHSERGVTVITITSNITDEDDTGTADDLMCDISVSGLLLPESHPAIRNVRDMMEVQRYIVEHRKYTPGPSGEYTIDYVKGSEVPAYVVKAVDDWGTGTYAVTTIANAMKKARETVGGDENMYTLLSDLNSNMDTLNYAKTKSGITTKYPESYANYINKLKRRASIVKPKGGKPGDISQYISELQAKLRDGLGWETPEDDD